MRTPRGRSTKGIVRGDDTRRSTLRYASSVSIDRTTWHECEEAVGADRVDPRVQAAWIEALTERFLASCPDRATAGERARDFAAHVELKRLIDRVAPRFSRR
jgi:hypothetical protein